MPSPSDRRTAPLRVALTNVKGGCGKTTVSVLLAHSLQYRSGQGRPVVVIDTDPHKAATKWLTIGMRDKGMSERFELHHTTDTAELKTLVRSIPPDRDVVIDTPANDPRMAMQALLLVQLAVVPVNAGSGDLTMIRDTLSLIEDVREVKPALRWSILLNRGGKSMPRVVSDTRDAIAKRGWPLLRTELPLSAQLATATGNLFVHPHVELVLDELLAVGA